MRYSIYFLVVVLVLNPCYAITLQEAIKEQESIALSNWQTYHHTIGGSEINISRTQWVVETFYGYIGDNIKHKFYFRPRGVYTTWKTKEGDCTDKAMLLQYMLDKVKIKNRLVHGFCNGVLHDWLEYKDGQWLTLENYRCNSLIKIGRGVW